MNEEYEFIYLHLVFIFPGQNDDHLYYSKLIIIKRFWFYQNLLLFFEFRYYPY